MQNNIQTRGFLSSLTQRNSGRRALLLLSAAIGLGLSACSSSPTPSYYSLNPTVTPLASSNVRVIEVMPVGLPDRLNRAPMVIQDVTGKSNLQDNQRWTSTLGAELRDGLSAGLQQKLGAVDRYNSGMTGGKVSYRIATEFARFDIVEQAKPAETQIQVVVAWIIKRDDPNRPLTQASTAIGQANQQLSCRMAFNNAVASTGKNNNNIPDIVNTSRSSLSQIVDAIAASVVASEAKTVMNMKGVSCS